MAVAAALMDDIKNIPKHKQGIQDEEYRLWLMLYVGESAARTLHNQNERRLTASQPFLSTYVCQIATPLGKRKKYNVKLSLGFGDHHEPVATLMKPDES